MKNSSTDGFKLKSSWYWYWPVSGFVNGAFTNGGFVKGSVGNAPGPLGDIRPWGEDWWED